VLLHEQQRVLRTVQKRGGHVVTRYRHYPGAAIQHITPIPTDDFGRRTGNEQPTCDLWTDWHYLA
jgi:hypothetical protein